MEYSFIIKLTLIFAVYSSGVFAAFMQNTNRETFLHGGLE